MNFVLILFGYVTTSVLAIVWWFYRGSVARADECLRHLEKDLDALAKDLNDWRLLSTRIHGELSAHIGMLEGKLAATMAKVQDYGIELRNLTPRVAVLEEETDPRRRPAP